MPGLISKALQLLTVTGSSATVVPQVLTDDWVKVGKPIAVGYYDHLIAEMKFIVNSSNDMRVRITNSYVTGGTEYIPVLESASGSSVVLAEQRYIELNKDIDQNVMLDFNVLGFQFANVEVQAGTVGATGASLTSCLYKMARNN